MKEHQQRHSAAKMAKVLKVSRSGYYAWKNRKPSKHKEESQELTELIKNIFGKHHGRYGSPRVWEELKALGRRVSRKRVERLMRDAKLQSRKLQKHIVTSDSKHDLEVKENILARNFDADLPGEKWVSDITYFRSSDGWLYLTTIIDLWDRKVIGWSIGEDLSARQVCRALIMATLNRVAREGLIFHSDRGVQYCSNEFRNMLNDLCPSVRQSMSRKGNCWDNACAESFFKTLKTELDLSKRSYCKKQIKTMIFEYIEIYYNRCRRHSALGYAIPTTLTNNFVA